MATTITGSTSSSYWTHKIVVTENSTSVSNNTSSVTVTAYIGRSSSAGSSYMYGASITDTISITGCSSQKITYSNSGTVTVSGGGWLNIGSTTFSSVPHNSDGSKTVTVSSSFSNNVSPSSGSASGSVTLTKINRYATITNFSVSSLADGLVYLNITTDVEIDSINYSIDGGTTWKSASSLTPSSTNKYISLDNDTTYSLKIRVRRKDSQLWTTSSAITVTTLKTKYAWVKVDDSWLQAIPYIKIDDTWKKAIAYVKVDGTWKEGL